jgi:hypothetical protein
MSEEIDDIQHPGEGWLYTIAICAAVWVVIGCLGFLLFWNWKPSVKLMVSDRRAGLHEIRRGDLYKCHVCHPEIK